MPLPANLDAVAAYFANLDLPFDWYTIGHEGDAIVFEVAPQDCTTAVRYFTQHPLTLQDQTPFAFSVRPRRGHSWTSPPHKGVRGPADAVDEDALIGLDVADAVHRANAAGWLVRARQAEAIITADLNPIRLNLVYDDHNAVVSVSKG